jgi:hypothetical protein
MTREKFKSYSEAPAPPETYLIVFSVRGSIYGCILVQFGDRSVENSSDHKTAASG